MGSANGGFVGVGMMAALLPLSWSMPIWVAVGVAVVVTVLATVRFVWARLRG